MLEDNDKKMKNRKRKIILVQKRGRKKRGGKRIEAKKYGQF